MQANLSWRLQVTSTLDKLAMRERFVNTQCEHMIVEYQRAREHLAQLQQQYSQKQDAVGDTDNELARVARVRAGSGQSHTGEGRRGSCIGRACCPPGSSSSMVHSDVEIAVAPEQAPHRQASLQLLDHWFALPKHKVKSINQAESAVQHSCTAQSHTGTSVV